MIIFTTEMRSAITSLRAEGLNVDMIAERLGVSREAFRRFRRITQFPIVPIKHSKATLVGRRDPTMRDGSRTR